jgi:hypothetical protein
METMVNHGTWLLAWWSGSIMAPELCLCHYI